MSWHRTFAVFAEGFEDIYDRAAFTGFRLCTGSKQLGYAKAGEFHVLVLRKRSRRVGHRTSQLYIPQSRVEARAALGVLHGSILLPTHKAQERLVGGQRADNCSGSYCPSDGLDKNNEPGECGSPVWLEAPKRSR